MGGYQHISLTRCQAKRDVEGGERRRHDDPHSVEFNFMPYRR